MKKAFALSGLALAVALAGCSDSDDSSSAPSASAQFAAQFPDVEVPETYTFESNFETGSSISYGGQTARLILIADLKSLAGDADDELTNAADGDAVLAELNALYDAESGSDIDGTEYNYSKTDVSGNPVALIPGPTFGDISSGKDLKGKIAGEDNGLFNGFLRGWTEGLDADPTPDEFVQYLFGLYAEHKDSSIVRTDTSGNALPIYITESGIDLQQLTNKFLLMSVAYSQGTGDYLSSGVFRSDSREFNENKGINSSTSQTTDKPYSGLEHAWDEGFGYFGAARDFNAYTDLEIRAKGDGERGKGFFDTNGDGSVDLNSEVNLAGSVNAAKRDVGAVAATDFTGDIFNAFLRGRALITAATKAVEEGTGTIDDYMGGDAGIEAQRNIIVNGWEKVYAATAVHYINDTLQDMNSFGQVDPDTGDSLYSFTDHAKHWSELKGFAMGLQFNPNALLSIADLETINNDLIGDAPVLPTGDNTAEVDAYKAALLEARDIFQAAYNFAEANMGDENGENGW